MIYFGPVSVKIDLLWACLGQEHSDVNRHNYKLCFQLKMISLTDLERAHSWTLKLSEIMGGDIRSI
ncbi:hypothetical protein KY290_022781 [Solanum tuberosum]|uniref:Uncharacterized protein n=1 Tax=Solanum tuberosum TaxID=4113 RepID=A0ABQ7V5E7_SOLTU|nr:hypothetical protein KY285_021603 [Solanum tuberosum]KAH0759288.1 hypothetical protein KY290_022781 [Solanum tuberosum]